LRHIRLHLIVFKPNYAIKGTAVKLLNSSFVSAAAVPNFGC